MAAVVYAGKALDDLERAFQHLAEHDPDAATTAAKAIHDPDAATTAAKAITEAVGLLAHHPFIGRIVEAELRELVVSFGRSGYVALYRFVPSRDEVRVLAIRHQRELEYPIP